MMCLHLKIPVILDAKRMNYLTKLPEENRNTLWSAWISFTICSTRESFIRTTMDDWLRLGWLFATQYLKESNNLFKRIRNTIKFPRWLQCPEEVSEVTFHVFNDAYEGLWKCYLSKIHLQDFSKFDHVKIRSCTTAGNKHSKIGF